MQQVDLPSHSLVQQYKRWGHLISHRISEMTHIVLFSTVAINKHEGRDGARGGDSFDSHFDGLLCWDYLCA